MQPAGRLAPDGIRVKDGQRFSFTILNRAGRNDRIAIAQVIQAQLKDVGIEVLMDTKESAAWTGQWRTGDWEAIVGGWFMTADPSVTNLYSCKGANNMTGYCDPKLDDAMNAADQALDFKDRKPLMDQVQVSARRRCSRPAHLLQRFACLLFQQAAELQR